MWTMPVIIQFIIFYLPICYLKHKNIQNCNAASGLIWAYHTKGRMQAVDVREMCTEEHVCAQGVEVIEGWEKLHNEDLNDLFSSPDVMWVIKSRGMR
jgi:hypothetical protein